MFLLFRECCFVTRACDVTGGLNDDKQILCIYMLHTGYTHFLDEKLALSLSKVKKKTKTNLSKQDVKNNKHLCVLKLKTSPFFFCYYFLFYKQWINIKHLDL